MPKKNIVKVNIRNHKAIVEDELIITIKHPKECTRPCTEIERIVEYLQDEMFIVEGFIVADDS
jgi:hypothetical protein